MLALIPLAGFTIEGTRFVTTSPACAVWSPVGNLVANLMRAAGMTPESAASLTKPGSSAMVIVDCDAHNLLSGASALKSRAAYSVSAVKLSSTRMKNLSGI